MRARITLGVEWWERPVRYAPFAVCAYDLQCSSSRVGGKLQVFSY